MQSLVTAMLIRWRRPSERRTGGGHRRKITSKDATCTFTVDAEPAKAGIDPLNKLIDRLPSDNVVRVEKQG